VLEVGFLERVSGAVGLGSDARRHRHTVHEVDLQTTHVTSIAAVVQTDPRDAHRAGDAH